MKLHLPSRLRAAVVTCLTMVSSFIPTVATGTLFGVFGGGVATWSLALLAAPLVQAGSLTQNTSEYNGTTYSGTVFTYNATGATGTQDLAGAVLTYVGTDGQTHDFNCAVAQTVDGVTSTSGWQVFASNQTCSYGQTLRLTGATADIFLNSTFTPYTLGGLITDAGDYTYTVGRSSGNCNIEFLANVASGFNMNIGANTIVKAGGSGYNIDVMTGGTWNIASGKTLTLTSASAINIASNVAVSITGGGTVRFNGTTNLSEGGTLTVGEGTTLQFENATSVTRTIVSDGTLAFGQNASLSIASIVGLESVGGVTYSDGENGYLNGSFIVIRASSADGTTAVTGLNTVTVAGTEMALTESNGQYIVTLDGTAGIYYVNAGTVEYVGDSGAASAAATGIILNGGSLEMQQNLADGVNITLSADGTVSLGQDVTLSSDRITRNEQTLTLGGTGKFIHKSADGDFSLSQYGFADDWNGTVELEAKSSGWMYLSQNTPVSYKGTMILNFGNHIGVGQNTSTTNSIFGEETHLVLNAGADNRAMVLNSQYIGEAKALTLASLSSGVDGDGNYVVSYIRGDMNTTGHRYLKVVGDDSTTFAGFFHDSDDRSVGLIKEGAGNLTLTNSSTSEAKLQVNSGTLTFKDGGAWAGAISVGAAGTLAFNGADKVIAADRNITFADGATLAVTGGSLTISKAFSVTKLDLSGGGNVTVEGTSTTTGTTGSLSFAEVTGSGDVTVTSAAATGSTTPGGEVYMGNIHNYSGTITVAAVEGSDRTVRISTIDQAEGVSGTITGEVFSQDFQKVGEGSITMETLNAGGTLHMNYQGTLKIGNLVVAENTTLVYGALPAGGGSGIDLGKVIEIGSLEHAVTLDVSAIDRDTLWDGIDLGLVVSGVDSNLLQGADDYELYPENGHWWLSVKPDELLWNNGTGTWNDTNVNWWDKDGTEVDYSDKANVTFVGDGDPAVVTIVGGLTASKMTVESGDFTFTKGKTDSLSLRGTLTIGNGTDVAAARFRFDLAAKKAVVRQNGTLEVEGRLTLDSLENNGQVTATDAMVLGTVTGTGALSVVDGSRIDTLDGAGSLTTAGEVQVGTVTDTLSMLTILSDSSLTLGSGATVGTLDNSGTLEVKGSLALTEASKLCGNVTAEDVALYADAAFAKLDAKTVNINNHTLTVGKGTRIAALEGTGSLVSEGGTVCISSKAMTSIRATGADIVLNNPGKAGTPALVLSESASIEGGSLTFSVAADDMLSETVAPRIIAGNLTLSGTTLALRVEGVNEETTGLDIRLEGSLRNVKLAQLADEVKADAASRLVQLQGGTVMEKYYTNARLQADGAIVADRVTDYYSNRISRTPNGSAAAPLLDELLLRVNPQAASVDMPDLAAAMNAVDAHIKAGDSAGADRTAAAMVGSSTAVLGLVLSDDMERQLKAIRNRTTGMGINERVVHEDMPYVNAWINAEGNHRELDAAGTAAGYKLNSWGGTVGVDVDTSPNLTFGLALTAMYGDLDADGADTAEGDFDTYYVAAFARFAGSSWTHTFVVSAGLADVTSERTVNYGSGSYKTTGDTDGATFGLLYELGYVVPLNEDATACLQPVFNMAWRHARLGGYTETGSDAALNVEDQSVNTVTFGLGARFRSVFGETVYNRTSLLELRALLKADAGDRRGESDVCFLAGDRSTTVQSEEVGAVGLEAGVGVTVPVGAEGGSIFTDVSLDIRDGYTGFNGTIGYRINF